MNRDRARHPFPYPGDNQDKRAARLFLYRHAADTPRFGHAITLAGSDPRAEVDLLKNYLQWPKERTWFIDYDKSRAVRQAIKSIRGLWPGVKALNEDLREILPRISSIGFIHLDFMGHLNKENVLPCIEAVVPKLLPGSIIGISWFRGRERWDLKDSAWGTTWQAGKGFKGNDRRWAGVIKTIDKISQGSLEFIAGLQYLHHHSPMSVSVFKSR